ncbi:serine/threonine-protein kinase PknK [Vitiosangium sp. GDMCC 1.1324]|uniref:serine/threonine-protein kinase n=1 Tax=Vitiosangium sp. (strain GDMCC 1.1324) TaxID=2138576 RepID=UPI000D34CD01|nr:AAA family ATPase [Vitiosangium sp. GDMCC 1.1324]PTL84729.1 serine/threonine-protein kinase PknK [Vitiosangium sp. GDMCC 1.1324]
MSAAELRAAEQGSIGPYRLLGKLSSGGMGVVYRARHEETGELAALKTVRVPEAPMLRGIRREIHALRRIQHPGVVRVLAEGVQEGLPWYAMEFIEGLTLRRYIDELWKRTPGTTTEIITQVVSTSEPPKGAAPDISFRAFGPPPEEQRRDAAMLRLDEVLTLARRLCSSLAFLHGEGIVHRDLKPENVVIRPDGTPVLVDFGLASLVGGNLGRESLEVSGSMEGSYVYMAPEQIKGGLVDARADLYSLGCILHELMVGQPPYPGSGWEVLRRHLQDKPFPLSRWVRGVPPDVDTLVLRMLAKVPRERIGYAADVGVVLAGLGAEDLPRAPSRTPRPYLYRPEFVGREQLLAELNTRLERSREGQGGCLLIGGESGAGKTRLVMECAVAASRHAFHVVTGGCLPLSGGGSGEQMHGEPLHAFKPLLQAIADECRQLGQEETDRLLGERGRVLALYEPALADLPGQDAWPEPPRLPPQAARERVMRCLAETLAAFSAKDAVLLVMDDLQWADELSLGVLDFLQAGFLRESHVLVVGTYRTEELDSALRLLLASPGVTHRALGQLDEPMVARMVEDMLAMSSPPASFVRFLTTRSAGNPFFVAEYLRTAIDERLLFRDIFGTWQVAAGDDAMERLHEALPLPGALHDLVGRRLDGLGPQARGLLEMAAVLGRELDADVLAAAAGLEDLQELEALEELRARHVLEDAGGGRLRFVHDKLREIAYESILPDRRRPLHRAAALALEANDVWGGVPPALYPVLAHHWEQAQDDVWTFEYLEKAGAHALKAGSNVEASGYLRRALELDVQRGRDTGVRVDAARRARWERLLGEAMHGLSEFEACISHCLRAMEDLGRPLPVTDGGWGRFLLAQTVRQVMHLVLPRRWVTEKDRQTRELLAASALAATRLAECYYWRYDPLRMMATALLAANLAERAGRDSSVLRLYGQLGSIAGLGRLNRVARAYFRRAQGEGQLVEDPSATSFGLIVESMFHASFARWTLSASKSSEAQEVLLRLGDKGELELSEVLLGHVDYYTGRFEAALTRFANVCESARKRGHFQHEVWSTYTMARSLLALGRLDEAMPLLREADGLLKGKHDPLSHIINGGLLGMAYLEREEWELAREEADKVMAVARQYPPMLFTESHGYEGAARVYLALWERERVSGQPTPHVAEEARRACARLSSLATRFPLARAVALRCSGKMYWLAGQKWRARSAWKRSAKLAREMGMPYDEAQAWFELARAAAPGSPERELSLRQAMEGFTRLGCAGLLREAEALQARQSLLP